MANGATVEDPEAVGRRLLVALERLRTATAGRAPSGRTHDDADDLAGTAETDDAIGFDPLPLLAAFDRAGASVVVIGQVAGILHGSTELTGDLDLLWSGDPSEVPGIVAAFAATGAALADDDGRPVPCTASSFALAKVQFRSPAASGDCCTPHLNWGELDVVAFQRRARSARVGPVTVRYVALDDLVEMRRAVGRPKDLCRADELEHIARPIRAR